MKDISDNSSLQPKRFWNFLNRLTNRPSIPDSVTSDDKLFITPDTKAEAFNYYFASAFNTCTVLPTDIDTTHYSHTNSSESFLNQEDFRNALLKIDLSKTPGPDLISSKDSKRVCLRASTVSMCSV